MRQYDVTLQMVTDAISQSNANVGGDILPLGPQSHNVRAIGYLGEGVDSLDPAVADHAYAIEVEKLEDIQDVVVTTLQQYAGLRQANRQGGHRLPAAAGGRRPQRRERRRRGHRADAEVREVAADLRSVQEKIDEINDGKLCPRG